MPILNFPVDFLLAPFRGHNPWWGLLWFSALSGFLLMAVFKLCSRPARVRQRRNRAVARLLELLLYRNDTVLQLRAFGGVLGDNLRYIGVLLPAMLLSLPLMLALIVQAHAYFGTRPAVPGENLLLSVGLRAGDPLAEAPALEYGEALPAAPDPVRVHAPGLAETAWRLHILPDAPDGVFDLLLRAPGGGCYRKQLLVGDTGLRRVSSRRVRGRWEHFLYPGEPRLPESAPFTRIRLHYPDDALRLAGHSFHWLVTYLVLSFVAGLLFKKPLRVEL